MKKKLIIVASAVLVLSMLLTSCSNAKTSSTASTTAKVNDTFVMAINSDPAGNVNPVSTDGRYGLMISQQVFSPLYLYTSPSDINYFLADSMTMSTDGLVYTAKLKSGVKFSDGTDFTADDVVFTFNTLMAEKTGQYYSPLQFGGDKPVVAAVDPTTVTFTFTKPESAALEVFGEPFIMSKAAYSGVSDWSKCTVNPVGTGPYSYSSYTEGDSYNLVANPKYFGGAPSIKNLVYKILPDNNTAELSLISGEVTGYDVDPTEIAKVTASGNVNIYQHSEGRIDYTAFYMDSTTGNPVSNIDFRKAVFYAINKTDIINGTFVSTDYAKPAVSYLPSTSPQSTTVGVEPYTYSVDTAKAQLAKANVKNPTVVLAYPTSMAMYVTQSAIIQQDLQAAGITCTLKPMDGTAMWNEMKTGKVSWDMSLGGYIMGHDASTFSMLFQTSTPDTNVFQISDKKLDSLFDSAVGEADQTKRNDLYAQAQVELASQAVFLPICENMRILAMSNKIHGVAEAKLMPVNVFEDMSKLSFGDPAKN